MPPPAIAIALLKVVASPAQTNHCPVLPHRKNRPLSLAFHHGWLRPTVASSSSAPCPTTKSTSSNCRVRCWMTRKIDQNVIHSGYLVKGAAVFSARPLMWRNLTPESRIKAGGLSQEPPQMGFLDRREDGDGLDEGNGSLGVGNEGDCGSQPEEKPKLLTIPTVLTLGRVAAVPLLIATFYMDGRWATTATTTIFIAASITDWLDGYLARKMSLGTAFGAFLDPVADKLMVAAALVLLCTKPLEISFLGQAPWLLTVPSIAIIGREITMSAVREWAASQNTSVLEAVAVNNLGKWKTATQMTALSILLASRDPSLAGQGLQVAVGVTLLNISAALAVWSLAVYMRKIWKVLLK
ncbi:CDP-diacylglycerol--glycerol-3-phosphate 3-phosphatidyltransferase 2-like [Wolffia australiana]